MSKVLVTGGAGFIGSHLVDRLIKDGQRVTVLDNLSTGKRENVNDQAELVEVDIADYEAIKPHFRGAEAVFHLAAKARIQPSIKNPLPSNQANITGTLNVLWAAKNAGVKKMVYSGSSSVYGDQKALPFREDMVPAPKSPYSLQKLVGENYARLFGELYGLANVTLRYFNVYGPRQLVDGPYATVIGIFLKQAEQGEPMTVVGDGEQRRDFTHVADVVSANVLAWQKDIPAGEVVNIGTGENFSVNQVAALIGEKTVNIPPRAGEIRTVLADSNKAKRLLGWQPEISLPEGIAQLKQTV